MFTVEKINQGFGNLLGRLSPAPFEQWSISKGHCVMKTESRRGRHSPCPWPYYLA